MTCELDTNLPRKAVRNGELLRGGADARGGTGSTLMLGDARLEYLISSSDPGVTKCCETVQGVKNSFDDSLWNCRRAFLRLTAAPALSLTWTSSVSKE
jgi:hypothetical protein